MLVVLILLFAHPGESLEIYTHPKCRPCQTLKADLEANPDLLGGRPATMIDLGDDPKGGRRRDVWLVPTFILLRDGREVERRTGYSSPESLQRWLGD